MYHSLTGMETTLCLVLTTLLIGVTYHLDNSPSIGRGVIAAFVGYLCYAAHGDLGIYAVSFPFFYFLLLSPKSIYKTFIPYILFFSIFLASDFLAKMYYFGTGLPLAFYVKNGSFYKGYIGHEFWSPLEYILMFSRSVLPFLLISIFTFTRHEAKLVVVFFLPLLLHFSYLMTVLQITGNHARFYFPAFPFIAVPALLMLDRFLSRDSNLIELGSAWIIQRLVIASLLIVSVSEVFGNKMVGVYRIYVLRAMDKANGSKGVFDKDMPLGWAKSLAEMAKLVQSLPPNSVVALSEIGYIGATSPQVKLIDIAGLNDNDIALKGFDMQKVLKHDPDIIWFPHYHYTSLVHQFLSNPTLNQDYDIYPGAFDYGLAIKKSSKLSKEIPEKWNLKK